MMSIFQRVGRRRGVPALLVAVAMLLPLTGAARAEEPADVVERHYERLRPIQAKLDGLARAKSEDYLLAEPSLRSGQLQGRPFRLVRDFPVGDSLALTRQALLELINDPLTNDVGGLLLLPGEHGFPLLPDGTRQPAAALLTSVGLELGTMIDRPLVGLDAPEAIADVASSGVDVTLIHGMLMEARLRNLLVVTDTELDALILADSPLLYAAAIDHALRTGLNPDAGVAALREQQAYFHSRRTEWAEFKKAVEQYLAWRKIVRASRRLSVAQAQEALDAHPDATAVIAVAGHDYEPIFSKVRALKKISGVTSAPRHRVGDPSRLEPGIPDRPPGVIDGPSGEAPTTDGLGGDITDLLESWGLPEPASRRAPLSLDPLLERERQGVPDGPPPVRVVEPLPTVPGVPRAPTGQPETAPTFSLPTPLWAGGVPNPEGLQWPDGVGWPLPPAAVVPVGLVEGRGPETDPLELVDDRDRSLEDPLPQPVPEGVGEDAPAGGAQVTVPGEGTGGAQVVIPSEKALELPADAGSGAGVSVDDGAGADAGVWHGPPVPAGVPDTARYVFNADGSVARDGFGREVVAAPGMTYFLSDGKLQLGYDGLPLAIDCEVSPGACAPEASGVAGSQPGQVPMMAATGLAVFGAAYTVGGYLFSGAAAAAAGVGGGAGGLALETLANTGPAGAAVKVAEPVLVNAAVAGLGLIGLDALIDPDAASADPNEPGGVQADIDGGGLSPLGGGQSRLDDAGEVHEPGINEVIANEPAIAAFLDGPGPAVQDANWTDESGDLAADAAAAGVLVEPEQLATISAQDTGLLLENAVPYGHDPTGFTDEARDSHATLNLAEKGLGSDALAEPVHIAEPEYRGSSVDG